MYLWGDAGFWLGVGHDSSLWRRPSSRLDGPNTVAPHQPMAAFEWLPPLLYSADKLWFKSINYLSLPKCVWINELVLLLFCVCFSLPIFLSLFPPHAPPLSKFQSPQWRDWKLVWWRTRATPRMKRKTTRPPKPQGQVTLGQFPLPPPPQAGHRAIAALLHHPRVPKRSHSRSLCLSGWHPKTGKSPSMLCAEVLRDVHPNWACLLPSLITRSSHGWL